MMIKHLLAIGLCASVLLTGCTTYTPYTAPASEPVAKQNTGSHRDWVAFRECNKGYCYWHLATRINGSANDTFEMTFHNGNLLLSRLSLHLKEYPHSSFVNDSKLHIIIDGEKTFSFDADAYISSKTKHIPVIFIVPSDTEPSLIYYMTHGYNARIVLEGENGTEVEMKISLMGFTKMLKLARS